MICLSLRVSGEKSVERNKGLDARVDEIKVIANSLVDSTSDLEPWLAELIAAETLKVQIAIVSKVFEDYIKDVRIDITRLNTLIKLYIKLPGTNPLKKFILSSLSEINTENKELLTDVVKVLLQDKYQVCCSSEDCQEFISLLNCINSCFNQEPSLFILIRDSCSSTMFHGTVKIISSSSAYLSDSSVTPVFKEEILRNIHSLTQSIITYLHKIEDTCLPVEFIESFLVFLTNDDLPLNTKTNIAIIIGMVNQLTKTYSWDDLVNKFSSSSPITVVSLCSGIYSSACQSLWIYLSDGQFLADFILYQLLSLEESNSSDCKLVLGVSRGVNQYTKIRLSSDIPLTSHNLAVERVLSYLWVHLEHPMDAVRHLASESLTNIVSLGNKFTDSTIISNILKEVISIPSFRRSKFVILSSLVSYIAVEKLLHQVPNLVEILVTSLKESAGAKHVVTSFEKLLSQHYKETERKEVWLKIWVEPVIECLDRDSITVLEQILASIIKLDPSVIQFIFQLDDKIYHNKIKIILLSLRVSQKIGVLKGSSDVKWKGFVEYSFLEVCLHHREKDARLALLGLIVDSPKSSELFNLKELMLVKSFIQYNINCQSAAFRQTFIALFKKFLTRLNDSHSHDKCSMNVSSNPNETIDDNARSCDYYTFLDWLVKFCCDQLFPGSSFSRRSTVLSMLSLVFSYKLCEKDIFTSKMMYRLLYVLQVDTYEENKKIAKEIIQQLDFQLLNLNDNSKVYNSFCDCLLFCSSIRPPDCISAAYCLSTLLSFGQVKNVFSELATCVNGLENNQVKDLGSYYCLSMLVDDLSCKCKVATQSIHKAAKEGPMYGLIYTIRHLLQDLNLHDLSDDKLWVDLIKELLRIGIDCTKAVSCIVNNSSPEGHLPMDLSLDFSNLTLADGSHQATSQLLLLCSWRTVKEVCLLFGEIVETIDIYPEDDGIHFSVKDVLTIGEHLTSLLSEIKHRGAFEQAYIGFCKLAATLWKYPKGHLHELPSIWLKETLDEIVSSKSKLCATRRSAGIPFIIQALVVTEREVLGGKQLNCTVERVLELGSSSSQSWETRVHSINILRSLYRSSHLGEAISPFVAQGFIISFNGFSAQTWSERNSATLLFSALITRVFGVNRSKSNSLSWKNKMTGRIFFQRYPQLYSVILDKLEKSNETDIHSVFPVLLLLSRLYPSSLEGSDSNLRLEDLIPYVTRCGGSNIMKIRCLAASALVGLLYPFNIPNYIDKILNKLQESTPENLVHGYLLQILQLLKSSDIPTDKTDFGSLINSWFKLLINILKTPKHSMISRCTCLNILFQLNLKYFAIISQSNHDELLNLINTDLNSNFNIPQKLIGLSDYLEMISITLLFYNSKIDLNNLDKIIIKLLCNENYEVFQIVLDFIHTIFNLNDNSNETLNQLINSIDESLRTKLKNLFEKSADLHGFLMTKMNSKSLHHEDSVKLILVIKELTSVIEKINNESDVKCHFSRFYRTENLKSCVLDCVSSYLLLNGKKTNKDEVGWISELLNDAVKCDFDCRMSAAQLLVKNYKLLINGHNSCIVLNVWNAMMHLICDDCEEIRSCMGDILDEKFDSVFALEKFLQLLDGIIEDKYLFACALTAWSVGPFCEEEYSLEESEKAFDKGDMNSYKEDIILTKSACTYLKKIFIENPEYLEKSIPCDVQVWLDEYTGFSTSCTTLHQILRSLDIYSENILDQYKSKYHFFFNFSSFFKNYELINEKNNFIIYK